MLNPNRRFCAGCEPDLESALDFVCTKIFAATVLWRSIRKLLNYPPPGVNPAGKSPDLNAPKRKVTAFYFLFYEFGTVINA